MNRFILVLITSLIVSSCSVRNYDGGGIVIDYMADIEYSDSNNQEIRIEGDCASACTMKLGAKKVCIYPDATLYFHEAFVPRTGLRSDIASYFLYDKYPPKIKQWVNKKNALGSRIFTVMSGKEAISLGINECKGK